MTRENATGKESLDSSKSFLQPTQSSSSGPAIPQEQVLSVLKSLADAAIAQHWDKYRPNIEKQINKITEKFQKKIVDAQNTSREELKEIRNSVLGSIALFSVLFTFLSLNVSIFSKGVTFQKAVVIAATIWLMLLAFLQLFILGLNQKPVSWRSYLTIAGAVAGVIILCAFLVFT